MINLRSIDTDNFWDIISLSVKPEQEKLVLSNAVSIAQSKVQPECIPMGVYDDDIAVGFVMYCLDQDDHEYWIYRLMIDQKYQSRGYGRKAMEHIIDLIRKDKDKHKIYLGVDQHETISRNLYQSLGFKTTGKIYGHEEIFVLE